MILKILISFAIGAAVLAYLLCKASGDESERDERIEESLK
jgi:hypothetical protein